jgi:hypothetical protein
VVEYSEVLSPWQCIWEVHRAGVIVASTVGTVFRCLHRTDQMMMGMMIIADGSGY